MNRYALSQEADQDIESVARETIKRWGWPQAPMTDLLEKAVATARRLPPDMQDEMARVLLALAGEEQPACQLTPEEEADQDEADAAEARGDYATDEEVRAIRAKYGL